MDENGAVETKDYIYTKMRVVIDAIIGSIYCFCFVFGTIANSTSLIYFLKEKPGRGRNKGYMTSLYRLISMNDTLICFLVLPIVIVSFSKYRDPVFFANSEFCTVWGLLWNVFPILSVFLVAILSFSRTVLMIYPLKLLDIKIPVIFLATFFTVLVIEKLIAEFSTYGPNYTYWSRHMVCYLQNTTNDTFYVTEPYDKIQTVIVLVVLALPVIPIMASFLTSLYKLRCAKKNEVGVSSTNFRNSKKSSAHDKATNTVILVTGIYILCNIPVLFSHFLFMSMVIKDIPEGGLKQSKKVVYYYLWVGSYVLLVAINASCNPLVYFTRMKGFRNFIRVRRNQDPSPNVTEEENG